MIVHFEVSYSAYLWLVVAIKDIILLVGICQIQGVWKNWWYSFLLGSHIVLILYLHSGSLKHKRPNEVENPAKAARTETSKQLSFWSSHLTSFLVKISLSCWNSLGLNILVWCSYSNSIICKLLYVGYLVSSPCMFFYYFLGCKRFQLSTLSLEHPDVFDLLSCHIVAPDVSIPHSSFYG